MYDPPLSRHLDERDHVTRRPIKVPSAAPSPSRLCLLALCPAHTASAAVYDVVHEQGYVAACARVRRISLSYLK